jgi:hypothetical protein
MRSEVRPSPSESATGFPEGTRRVGNDGRTYEVRATVKGVKRWVPAPDLRGPHAKNSHRGKGKADELPGHLTYGDGTVTGNHGNKLPILKIIDNGSTPFLVVIVPDRTVALGRLNDWAGVAYVYIQENPDRDFDEDVPMEQSNYVRILRLPFSRALLGMDPEDVAESTMLRSKRQTWVGRMFFRARSMDEAIPKVNSVLLHRKGSQYTSIGESIYDFRLQAGDERIVDYWSVLGNSAVPYPYAISTSGNIFFTLEKVGAAAHELYPAGTEPVEYGMDPHGDSDPYHRLYDMFYRGKSRRTTAAFRKSHAMRGVRELHKRVI